MADLLKKLNLNGTEYELGMSSEERAKLAGVAEGAQANVIEGVQVDGTDLAVTDKKVNIDLATPIKEAKDEAVAAGAVTIAEAAGTGDILKTYTFSQNGATIGTINLAKDLVVSGGSIVEEEGVKYLSLTIANQADPVKIPVTDLVDVYTGSAYIDIATDNTISVKFADLATALAAEGNAVGDAIKANATAAAAAKTAAEGAQAAADAAQDAADDAQAKAEEVEGILAAHVADAVAHITADERTAWNAAKSTADANKTKLDGVAEGANKVAMSVSGDTLTVNITEA